MGKSTDTARLDGPSRSRPLRVCHLAYTFYENDNRVIRYAETLAAQGAEVDVIALRRSAQARSGEIRGVRVHRIQQRAKTEKRPWTYFAKVLWFLIQATVVLSVRQLRRPYDIVHVHNVPDFLVAAALIPRLTGARIILDIHDVLPELYAGKFGGGSQSVVFRCLLLIERLSCRFADHVIVANHLWHERLLERAITRERSTPLINYPDLRVFTPRPRGPKRADGRFIILYPGTLNYHQGLDIAVRAFDLAKDRMPTAELHIYGEGPAKPQLARLAQERGLADKVKLMDPLPIEQIAAVMASADLGVEPKRAEGFGNEALSTKILEFMACGVPVVVSRTLIHAHYFEETLVRFFQPGQERDLAEALVEMYQRGSGPVAPLDRARNFAIKNSWQVRQDDYLHVIDALLAASGRRGAAAAYSRTF